MSRDVIVGSEFVYVVDKSQGLSADGYIATGTESIVYKGMKLSKDGQMKLSCVLKFKYKSIRVGSGVESLRTVDVLDRFKQNDLRIFDDLQSCRSVVRIYDIIEDLGEFVLIDDHVPDGKTSITIDRSRFFCVVEEYIDGWSLEEYCRDEYWKLTETIELGNKIKRKIGFHEFSEERQEKIIESYHRDYNEIIRYQNEMFRFMINLCEIMEFITDTKRILHLDIKPDNIMVTKHGKEIVLIDFGRAEYIPRGRFSVQSKLSGADYSSEERIERMFQYGTLGYAAPECYVPAIRGSDFPFSEEGYEKGNMSIESDIFSFGATFWECLNIFELYTGSPEYAKDKGIGGSYDFYRANILNDEAYFDRDLSLTSSHYHEELEKIIRKCTKKRAVGYDNKDNPDFYHSYTDLKNDIEYARDSAPTLVKTENIKVRNSFGVVGVMAGFLTVLLLICGVLKLTGSYFAERKMDSIMENYNPTKIEWLESAAIEQMQSSTENEKHEIFDRVYTFLYEQDDGLEYTETVALTELLKEVEDGDFINRRVDRMLLNVDSKGFSGCAEYTVTNLDDHGGIGYTLAVQIYNARKRVGLSKCYEVLKQYADSTDYAKLTQRLAQDLNHDEMITKIAEEELGDSSGDSIVMAEKKHEIQDFLNGLGTEE